MWCWNLIGGRALAVAWLSRPLLYRQGLHCVPLYDTLGENSVEYIIDHSERCDGP